MSTTQRVNAVEKDLEKFIKFLALKSVQVVVQARLGEKFQTKCNALATGNDWFNIVIQDHPDVATETKHALALKPGDSILQRLPLSVEISLKTVDGDQMILEVWTINLQPLGGDKDCCTEHQLIKASHAIYNRMGILLKSLITLTRTTPAYKLSRHQSPDSYDIYYRIYVDRPQLHTLGEGYKQVRIGQLNTIVGTLSMSVAYRTKMTFSPTAVQGRNAEGNAMMVKSDHFRPSGDGSPRQSQSLLAVKKGSNASAALDRKIIDIEKPLRPGAFTDVGKIRQFTEDDYVLPETPPFEWLVRHARHDSNNVNGSAESLNRKCESPSSSMPFGNVYQQQMNIYNNNNNHSSNCCNSSSSSSNINMNNNNVHALNQNLTLALQQNGKNRRKQSEKSDGSAGGQLMSRRSQSPIKSLLVPTPPATRHISVPTISSVQTTACDEENLLKELTFPFATTSTQVDDLAKFYRDCYHAPPLTGVNEKKAYKISNPSSSLSGSGSNSTCAATAYVNVGNTLDPNAVGDLSWQLENFETSLEDYDKLVSQLNLSGSSSTGSRSSSGLQMSN